MVSQLLPIFFVFLSYIVCVCVCDAVHCAVDGISCFCHFPSKHVHTSLHHHHHTNGAIVECVMCCALMTIQLVHMPRIRVWLLETVNINSRKLKHTERCLPKCTTHTRQALTYSVWMCNGMRNGFWKWQLIREQDHFSDHLRCNGWNKHRTGAERTSTREN